MDNSIVQYIAIISLVAIPVLFYNAYTGIVLKKARYAMRFGCEWWRGETIGWKAVLIGIESLIIGFLLLAFTMWAFGFFSINGIINFLNIFI